MSNGGNSHEPVASFTTAQYERVSFPGELRPDGLALTYMTPDQGVLLVPLGDHDFAASRLLHEMGLSAGSVEEKEGHDAIYYPPALDLVTFSGVLNASAQVESGYRDIVQVLNAVNNIARLMKDRTGVLPDISDINGIAIDRTSGAAEFLAPFSVNQELSPEAMLRAIIEDAKRRCRTYNDIRLINNASRAFYAQSEGTS